MKRPFIYLLFTICISLFSFAYAEKEPFILIRDQASLPILTPSLSDRRVEKLRLPNQLEVYLVSDPEATKSSAAMAVNVGSWSDPVEAPGMAHFLEHMLFLGTEKYPEESAFQRFIDNHGGEENAYTGNDRTVYYFSIDNKAFPEAIDRFAQFFIAPLFNPSGVDRESHAIDQEYAKNLQNDAWRLRFVQKALNNPEHPNHRFNIGNLNTIAHISSEQLKTWYKEHYSANLMHLVIYSQLPIEQLKNQVIESFGSIPNSHKTPLAVNLPLSLDLDEKLVHINPYQEIQELFLEWNLPSSLYFDAEIVSHYLGYEDDKSLLAALKREGLAHELSTSVDRYGDEMALSIDISLTKLGVKEVEKVIATTFQAIALLKKKGIPEPLFQEMKEISTLKYQYASRQNPLKLVSQYADALIDEDLSTFPEKTLITSKYSPEDIEQVVSSLTPYKAHYFLIAPIQNTSHELLHEEPWLGAKYHIDLLSKELLTYWAQLPPSETIDLPSANPFIPTHLSLVSKESQSSLKGLPHPTLLLQENGILSYYLRDDRFLVPEVVYAFKLHSSQIQPGNATDAVLKEIFIKGVQDNIHEISYQAGLANLKYELSSIETGLQLVLHGYSEKSSALLNDILKACIGFNLTEATFSTIKESLLQDYENAAKDTPLNQGKDILRSLVYKNLVTAETKAAAIKTLLLSDLLQFSRTLLSQLYIEALFYGNLTKEEATQSLEEAREILRATPLDKQQFPKRSVLLISQDKGPFVLEKEITQPGNAVLLAIEESCFSFEKQAASQLLSLGMQEPFYSELRTNQQTGYLVGNLYQEVERELFHFFLVQSSTHDPRDLLARFELFIEKFSKNLSEEISEERFVTLKNTLIQELSQPPKNLTEMALMLVELAFSYDGQFDWQEKRIQGFQNLTYKRFTELTRTFLGQENHRRLAILVQGELSSQELRYHPINSTKQFQEINSYLFAEEAICSQRTAVQP